MAHAQKPDFVFRRNGRVHLNRQGASVQSTTGSRGVWISRSNAGYNVFRGSVKSTGYTFNSSVSPSLPLPCVTVCHHISTGLYKQCICYKSYSVIWVVRYTSFCYLVPCRPRTRTQYRVWSRVIKKAVDPCAGVF
jgi:hypothetical protein